MAYLKAEAGLVANNLFPLAGDRSILGRLPSNEIVLDNGAVSRTHAQITCVRGVYYLEDLRSRNGTQLNLEPIQGRGRQALQHNDVIKICEVELRFLAFLDVPAVVSTPPVEDPSRISATYPEISPRVLEHDSDSSQPRPAPLPQLVEDGSSSGFSAELSTALSTELLVRPEQKLKAILEISRDLGGQLRLDLVFTRILTSLFKIFPQADRGVVVLQDPQSDVFRVQACVLRGPHEELNSERISTTILRTAINESKAVLCDNTQGDPRFMSESVANLRIRSFMCVPLGSPLTGLRGAIQLDSFGLGKVFRQEDLDLLAAVCVQASLAVENAHLHEQSLRQAELDRDLQFAIQVQQGFLPGSPPRLTGYELFDVYRPARCVGGDLFDYVTLPDGRTIITVGDVAGKGVPAALLMARMSSEARSALLASGSPTRAMTELNDRLADGSLGHRFITLLMLTVEPGSRELSLVNAGHPPPLLRSADGRVTSVGIQNSGLPLGIEPGWKYQHSRLTLQPGDSLLLFTDGVTDAINRGRECFGNQRLLESFRVAGNDPETIVDAVLADIEQFSDGAPRADDLCLICLTHTPHPPAVETHTP